MASPVRRSSLRGSVREAGWECQPGGCWQNLRCLPEAVPSCSGALAGGSLPAPRPACSLTPPRPRSLDRGLHCIVDRKGLFSGPKRGCGCDQPLKSKAQWFLNSGPRWNQRGSFEHQHFCSIGLGSPGLSSLSRCPGWSFWDATAWKHACRARIPGGNGRMARSRAGPVSLAPSGVSPRRGDAGSTFPSPALAQARRCSLSWGYGC